MTDKPEKAELLRRATGAKLPPPASGIKLTAPLPVGKAVTVPGARDPRSLTDMERRALEEAGWTDDMPLTANTRDILAAMQEVEVDVANLPMPVDPTKYKLDMPAERPLSSLPQAQQQTVLNAIQAGKQARMRAALEQDLADEQAAAAEANRRAAMELQDPSIAAAYEMAEQLHEAPAPPVTPPKTEEPEKVDTGATAQTHICPHCNGDTRQEAIPEPSYLLKMTFLNAVLAEQPFEDETELLGGKLVVRFRTLSVDELDLLYKQCWAERDAKLFSSDLDFFEKLNRYRLYAQLASLKSVGTARGFDHTLPAGLTRAASPTAETFWEDLPDWKDYVVEGDVTPLAGVGRYITRNVLKQESLFRVVNVACNRFNRVAAKLELMMDDSDFWQPTEEPS